VWLVTGQGDPPEGFGNIRAIDSEEEVPAGFVAVKEFHLTFAAGVGIEPTWEEINESENVYYKASFFEKRHIKPERCKRARVSGDSMSPLINSGDVILFYSELDPNPQFVRIADGAVYCLAVDGNLKIKRLTTSKAGTTLISENETKYPPEVFTGEEVERLRIYGRVLEVVHSL
jgi:phage repressor protein C with HTH and peptisase S24 domain